MGAAVNTLNIFIDLQRGSNSYIMTFIKESSIFPPFQLIAMNYSNSFECGFLDLVRIDDH